tara:strand:- start:3264 stop:3500 length:237 start_codon:yes stop_codon:yes gene_type:complete
MEFNYKTARDYLYPHPYIVTEAMHPLATDGDATKKVAIDAHINFVNTAIPADSTKYTKEQLDAKLTELKKDSAFLSID